MSRTRIRPRKRQTEFVSGKHFEAKFEIDSSRIERHTLPLVFVLFSCGASQ